MKTTWTNVAYVVITTALVFITGCEEPKETSSANTTIAPPPAADGSSVASNTPPVNVPPVTPAQPPTTGVDTTDAVVAEPGVGVKGRYESNDYYSTVVGSYFGALERLAFDRAQSGLNSYKAMHGDYPKTHEEYWKEVIEANGIDLPELPAGHEYYYDYQRAKQNAEEALLVVQPKK